MEFTPSINRVKELSKNGLYDVVPVSCEILSDFTTPIETMRILKSVSSHCYLLESAQADETWGRYTFLGFDPLLEVTCTDGIINVSTGNNCNDCRTFTSNDPSGIIRDILSHYRSPRFEYLPAFTGGLVGYFSYDYIKYSEPAIKPQSRRY